MRLLLLPLLLLAAPVASAQALTADAAFHTAAQQFIGDDAQSALATIAQGLSARPRDAKLVALRDEILKQQEEQQNQNGDQDQQDGEQGDQQQDGQGQNDEQQQGDQNGDNSEDNQGDDPEQGDQDDQPGDQDGDGQPDQPGDQPPPPQPGQAQPQPGQMTQAQAERILQALGNEEANVLKRKAQKRGPARRVEKDW